MIGLTTKQKSSTTIEVIQHKNGFELFENLMNRKASLAIVGLGYVGLPIALEFAKKMNVIGFDINKQRVDLMKHNIDPSDELESSAFANKTIDFVHEGEKMASAQFYIVAVPTPIDAFKMPDLGPLKGATKSVANVLKKGDYVVFESTVYPGCTDEICVPILEEVSGLKLNKDFKIGYSPERINPGDKKNTIDKIVKIVSGSDSESLDIIAEVYKTIITAGVHKATTIKVAEAAKIVENTQRDINIALMNELSQIFEKAGINTFDVLEAAGTKWNFLKFYPGLVGGHCIGVDPYYLMQRSLNLGHYPTLITAGRKINDDMPSKIAQNILEELKNKGKLPTESKILIMGVTFKENVTDIRNSKVADLVQCLSKYCKTIDVVDPLADSDDVKKHYGFKLKEKASSNYDVIVCAVSHNEYLNLKEEDFLSMSDKTGLLFDIKGVYRGKIKTMTYKSL